MLYTSIKIYNKYKESPRKASAYQQDESPYSSKQQQQARGKQLVSKQQQHDDNKKNNAKYKQRKQSLFINSSRTAVVVISCSYSYVLYMLQLAESVALVHNEDGWTKGCDTSLSLSLSRLASGSLASWLIAASLCRALYPDRLGHIKPVRVRVVRAIEVSTACKDKFRLNPRSPQLAVVFK